MDRNEILLYYDADDGKLPETIEEYAGNVRERERIAESRNRTLLEWSQFGKLFDKT